LLQGNQVALIANTGKLKSGNKAMRTYAAGRLEKLFLATAYITPSAFYKMVMNLFLGGSKMTYTIKIFFNNKGR
jgi:hypothetical protein